MTVRYTIPALSEIFRYRVESALRPPESPWGKNLTSVCGTDFQRVKPGDALAPRDIPFFSAAYAGRLPRLHACSQLSCTDGDTIGILVLDPREVARTSMSAIVTVRQ